MQTRFSKDKRQITSDFAVINISADSMSASARILDSVIPPKQLAFKLRALIKSTGIKHGLISDNLVKLIKERNIRQELEIASGTPAPLGRDDVEIETLAKFDKRPNLPPDELAELQLSSLRRRNIVKKGQPLLAIHKMTRELPGITIFGANVAGNSFVKPFLELGDNVAYNSEDHSTVVAMCDGLCSYDGNRVSVTPHKIIKSDINLATGDIEYDGSLIIVGDIKSGRTVVCSGDVEIIGTVEDAYIKSGRDIYVSGGFLGRGRGCLDAHRHVVIGFARQQEIRAGNTVVFFNELMGCTVHAGKHIISKQGGIFGGRAEAKEKITLHFAGREEAVKTDLVVGRPGELPRQRRIVSDSLENMKKQVSDNKQAIYDLAIKQLDGGLNGQELTQLETCKTLKEQLPREIEKLQVQLEALDKELMHIEAAHVEISGAAHEKVIIEINEVRHQLTGTKIRRLFRHRQGQIAAVPI